MPKKPDRAREPLQVYLDSRDRELLDRLAERESVARAEILRMALRRLGAELAVREEAGSGVRALLGVLDGRDVPTDLAARHDEYLYPAAPARKRRAR